MLAFSFAMQPNLVLAIDDAQEQDNLSSTNIELAPPGIQAKISWPLIGRPAIMLNGSTFEARIKGPNNISLTDWNFTLYREYRNHSLTYDTPLYNITTGEWLINLTIPVSAEYDLYDLQVGLTDGVNNLELTEWNSVQVRYEYPTNLTIFHVTDTHQVDSWSGMSEITLSTIYQASMAAADLIIYTGDLTQDGTIASFNFFKNMLRQSRVPTFICPGNHDKGDLGDYSVYRSVFGPDYYAANFGPDILIVLANSGASGILNMTQIGWIERDMAASTAQLKIMGFHHPLYYVREPGYDPYNFFLDDAEATELIRICDTYDVDIVLTGHLHNDRVDRVNDTLWILTTSCGGGPWTAPTDPGFHKDGYRMIEIENYIPVSWNYTPSLEWSWPWDEIQISRTPRYLHDLDVGGYATITNQRSEPIIQIVDFIVCTPGAGITLHTRDLVSGFTEPVIETVNGTYACLVRFNVSLDAGASTTLLIYPSNAHAPIFYGAEYPASVRPGIIYYLYVNWTNPDSGVLSVGINMSLNDEPFTSHGMTKQSDGRYRYTLFLTEHASIRWRTVAADYSVRTHKSDMFYIEDELATGTLPTIDPVLILAGTGVAVIVIVVVVIFWFRRRSSMKSP